MTPRPPLAPLAALTALLGLTACSSAALVNAVTARSGYTIERNLPYGEDPRQRVDLYRPVHERANAPLIVFFYGGSWKFGDKDDYRFLAEAMTSLGYPVAVPDYRVYPDVRFPEFLIDGAAAVRFARSSLPHVDGRRRRVVLMGHSAGAYNAAMLALDPRWLGSDREALSGLIGLAGPYDFLPLGPDYADVFSPAMPLESSQPISFAQGRAAPALLIVGTKDKIVLPRNSERLAEALERSGNSVALKRYERPGHVLLVGTLAWPLRWVAPVLGDIEAFLAQRPG